MYSEKLVNFHFWTATIGTVIYIVAMWVSGIMQGLMWRAYDEYGTLAYTFAESVDAMHPYYAMRAIGGMIFLLGADRDALQRADDRPQVRLPGQPGKAAPAGAA
jgi:cytochrome c oxidase cbb3-type subunit I